MTPKISVIIPTHNRKHLIGYTINNILNQTYKPDEIIVIDDKSEDGTLEWLEKKYPNQLILLSSKKAGPGAARNAGLEVASGDYIQFFDSDDLMTQNKFEVQTSLLGDIKDTFVYGPYAIASAPPDELKLLDAILQYKPLPEGNILKWIYRGWCSITQACMFPKELIHKVGLWREDIHTHEDREFWYRVFKSVGQNPIHENQSCTLYRQHTNQLTLKHERQIQRSLDAITVDKSILANNHNIDLLSKQILKARISFTQNYLSDISEKHKEYKQLTSKHLNIFHRLNAKINRMRSGNNWQLMYGANTSIEVFNSYFNNQ